MVITNEESRNSLEWCNSCLSFVVEIVFEERKREKDDARPTEKYFCCSSGLS